MYGDQSGEFLMWVKLEIKSARDYISIFRSYRSPVEGRIKRYHLQFSIIFLFTNKNANIQDCVPLAKN